jgi:hypothetical protein
MILVLVRWLERQVDERPVRTYLVCMAVIVVVATVLALVFPGDASC